MSAREEVIAGFLAGVGWGDAERRPLAADASFRRYDRLTRAGGESAVLMDAPPPNENVAAFHQIQSLLLELAFSAPRALGVDQAHGLMLLEDLGDRTFTRALSEGAEEAALYRLAVDLLIDLHQRFEMRDGDIPPYDDTRLLEEATLFLDWYLPAIGQPVSDQARADYLAIWQELLPVARRVPESLVLRDYHVDNLMVVEGREGLAACGLLDFQDAVIGPVTYDLVSLLEDVRRDVSGALVDELRARYLSAMPGLDPDVLAASYAVMGAQRNAKIIGIFTRLCRRDGKPGYLRHIPRTWRLLEGDLRHPALAGLAAWFARTLPAERRVVPCTEAQP
ncbi:MAG: phosphotransferase [Pseudomonadota bacterium]